MQPIYYYSRALTSRWRGMADMKLSMSSQTWKFAMAAIWRTYDCRVTYLLRSCWHDGAPSRMSRPLWPRTCRCRPTEPPPDPAPPGRRWKRKPGGLGVGGIVRYHHPKRGGRGILGDVRKNLGRSFPRSQSQFIFLNRGKGEEIKMRTVVTCEDELRKNFIVNYIISRLETAVNCTYNNL